MSLARYALPWWQAGRKPVKGQPLKTRIAYSTTVKDILHRDVRRPDTVGKSTTKDRVTDGGVVTVNGWIRSVRKMKSVAFVALGDGSTAKSVQIILPREYATGLSTGAAVQITGTLKESPEGLEQDLELHATDLRVLGASDGATYPLQKKYHSEEFLRTIPHLRPRTSTNALLLQLRSSAIRSVSDFFADRSYVQTHPPIITSSDCEGAGEVFTLAGFQIGKIAEDRKSPTASKRIEHHFKTPKYLTVSSQLHLEALVHSIPQIWTLSPTFRAEKSDTNRHLSEFYMLEAELFAEQLEDVMNVAEDMLKGAVLGISESRVGSELLAHLENAGEVEQRWKMVGKPDSERWPRITYTRAVDLLLEAQARGHEFRIGPEWSTGLSSEQERYLAEHFGAGGVPGPVFITDYPSSIKPFYMLPNENASAGRQTVACFDLLFPGMGEVVGGSLREHRYEPLLKSMHSHGLIPEGTRLDKGSPAGGLQWYADLRRWGSIPHGGYGLGFDRFLAWIAGVENLREIVAFPRWFGRCDC